MNFVGPKYKRAKKRNAGPIDEKPAAPKRTKGDESPFAPSALAFFKDLREEAIMMDQARKNESKEIKQEAMMIDQPKDTLRRNPHRGKFISNKSFTDLTLDEESVLIRRRDLDSSGFVDLTRDSFKYTHNSFGVLNLVNDLFREILIESKYIQLLVKHTINDPNNPSANDVNLLINYVNIKTTLNNLFLQLTKPESIGKSRNEQDIAKMYTTDMNLFKDILTGKVTLSQNLSGNVTSSSSSSSSFGQRENDNELNIESFIFLIPLGNLYARLDNTGKRVMIKFMDHCIVHKKTFFFAESWNLEQYIQISKKWRLSKKSDRLPDTIKLNTLSEEESHSDDISLWESEIVGGDQHHPPPRRDDNSSKEQNDEQSTVSFDTDKQPTTETFIKKEPKSISNDKRIIDYNDNDEQQLHKISKKKIARLGIDLEKTKNEPGSSNSTPEEQFRDRVELDDLNNTLAEDIIRTPNIIVINDDDDNLAEEKEGGEGPAEREVKLTMIRPLCVYWGTIPYIFATMNQNLNKQELDKQDDIALGVDDELHLLVIGDEDSQYYNKLLNRKSSLTKYIEKQVSNDLSWWTKETSRGETYFEAEDVYLDHLVDIDRLHKIVKIERLIISTILNPDDNEEDRNEKTRTTDTENRNKVTRLLNIVDSIESKINSYHQINHFVHNQNAGFGDSPLTLPCILETSTVLQILAILFFIHDSLGTVLESSKRTISNNSALFTDQSKFDSKQTLPVLIKNAENCVAILREVLPVIYDLYWISDINTFIKLENQLDDAYSHFIINGKIDRPGKTKTGILFGFYVGAIYFEIKLFQAAINTAINDLETCIQNFQNGRFTNLESTPYNLYQKKLKEKSLDESMKLLLENSDKMSEAENELKRKLKPKNSTTMTPEERKTNQNLLARVRLEKSRMDSLRFSTFVRLYKESAEDTQNQITYLVKLKEEIVLLGSYLNISEKTKDDNSSQSNTPPPSSSSPFPQSNSNLTTQESDILNTMSIDT